MNWNSVKSLPLIYMVNLPKTKLPSEPSSSVKSLKLDQMFYNPFQPCLMPYDFDYNI